MNIEHLRLFVRLASTHNISQVGQELVLEDYPLADNAAIWAVYPISRLVAPKVRAFIDYFAQYYGTPPYWDVQVKA